MTNQSRYDPSRKTVGAIYRDAQISHNGTDIVTGDLTYELQKSLVYDLNQTIHTGTAEFGGKPFYITVHEKKDLQMPNAILRRMIKTLHRPWPEDDTVVFKVTPKGNDVRFCWCLPHWSEMNNMLANPTLFDAEMIRQIKAWKNLDLHFFGFMKDQIGDWTANPNFQDAKLEPAQKKGMTIIKASF